MTEYPRLYRSGIQIKMVSRSNVEILNINRSSKRVYHKHTGDKTKGTGCYSLPVYHIHAGDIINGGECYTGEIHRHDSSCYSTPSYGWGLCGWCNASGNFPSSGGTCSSCGRGPCYPKSTLSCGKSETTSYTLSCGKTEETIEYYDINCGYDV